MILLGINPINLYSAIENSSLNILNKPPVAIVINKTKKIFLEISLFSLFVRNLAEAIKPDIEIIKPGVPK